MVNETLFEKSKLMVHNAINILYQQVHIIIYLPFLKNLIKIKMHQCYIVIARFIMLLKNFNFFKTVSKNYLNETEFENA